MSTATSFEASYDTVPTVETAYQVEFEVDQSVDYNADDELLDTSRFVYAQHDDGQFYSQDPSGEMNFDYQLQLMGEEQQAAFAAMLADGQSQTVELLFAPDDRSGQEAWSIVSYAPAGYDEHGRQLIEVSSYLEWRMVEQLKDSDEPVVDQLGWDEPAGGGIGQSIDWPDNRDDTTETVSQLVDSPVINTVVDDVEQVESAGRLPELSNQLVEPEITRLGQPAEQAAAIVRPNTEPSYQAIETYTVPPLAKPADVLAGSDWQLGVESLPVGVVEAKPNFASLESWPSSQLDIEPDEVVIELTELAQSLATEVAEQQADAMVETVEVASLSELPVSSQMPAVLVGQPIVESVDSRSDSAELSVASPVAKVVEPTSPVEQRPAAPAVASEVVSIDESAIELAVEARPQIVEQLQLDLTETSAVQLSVEQTQLEPAPVTKLDEPLAATTGSRLEAANPIESIPEPLAEPSAPPLDVAAVRLESSLDSVPAVASQLAQLAESLPQEVAKPAAVETVTDQAPEYNNANSLFEIGLASSSFDRLTQPGKLAWSGGSVGDSRLQDGDDIVVKFQLQSSGSARRAAALRSQEVSL